MAETPSLRDRASTYVRDLQDRICAALEAADGKARFHEDRWEREGGGGGISRVMEGGAVFEKAGVNTSAVYGEVPSALARDLKGAGPEFYATGVSLVLHPRNPHVPTVHANFRFLARGDSAWFGGGADLTPYYPREEDVRHFHGTLKAACDAHGPALYPRYKKWCDEYFYLPHRREMRGVGGIFFDELAGTEESFAFLRSAGEAFLPAYLPIVERRKDDAHDERHRAWQLHRRGRYVEFNLIYDRGTIFGLRSNGRIESILMSLPPLASWDYDPTPKPGSPEEQAVAYYQPRDWA
ncbi:oxygen-dependent coproporphyrinogen oxidase [Vulgatibacter incomptus]|uniref:Oxygen-dependent coproporphyrinogen-III oxidase n=1 Tax=Vulgatibacter incomptus TaxID=1391653 RepID=A0A0K1PAY1_9BACT|nr:oxygen-dependent coproporphyrinogen oxidase [Vulgatibacter incomptus]AKU90264.1 Coproporphyrinogen III oxidase, aerobic [Vulgatibacter incomptus]